MASERERRDGSTELRWHRRLEYSPINRLLVFPLGCSHRAHLTEIRGSSSAPVIPCRNDNKKMLRGEAPPLKGRGVGWVDPHCPNCGVLLVPFTSKATLLSLVVPTVLSSISVPTSIRVNQRLSLILLP